MSYMYYFQKHGPARFYLEARSAKRLCTTLDVLMFLKFQVCLQFLVASLKNTNMTSDKWDKTHKSQEDKKSKRGKTSLPC